MTQSSDHKNTKWLQRKDIVSGGMNSADIDEGLEEYIAAAHQGDLTTVKNGLESEDKISTIFTFMLGAAACNNQIEIIKFLIMSGADINANEDGETPLMVAVRAAQVEITQLLIENGADVPIRMNDGAAALHQTVKSHEITKTKASVEIIDQLIAKGMEIGNRDHDGRTVLHDAASYGRVDLLPELLMRGASINARNKWQDTPLDCACFNGYIDAVKLLASHGAEINNSDPRSCKGLDMAALHGQLNLVTFLLDNGAKALPSGREAPELLCAARSGVPEVVQLLIDHGCSNQGPRSFLQASLLDPVQVVAQLIDHGVRPDVQNTQRRTALHMAVLGKKFERQTTHSRNEVIKLLINKGIDVNAVDAQGKTAFDIATELDYLDVVAILNEP